MRRYRWMPSPKWLAVTFLVSIAVLVPLTVAFAPTLHRWRMLGDLTSNHLHQRQQALSYVAQQASTDPQVRRGAIAKLPQVNKPDRFLEIARALEAAGVWSRAQIPPDAWLRWLGMLAASPEADTRIFAAGQLAQLVRLADDPRVAPLVKQLITDKSEDVRYNALVTAGALAGAASPPGPYVSIIAIATHDAQPGIARHAWIMLGLLNPVFGFPAHWRDAPPQVAQAILWAATKTNPSNPQPAIQALRDKKADPSVRAAAAYALHLSHTPEAVDALLDVVDVLPTTVTKQDAVVVWRAILSLPKPDIHRRPYTRLENAISAYAMDFGSDPLLEPLALAATYRLGIEGARRQTDHPLTYDLLMKLATVEGQQPPWMYWPLTGYKPDILRDQTIAIAKSPHPRDMLPALDTPDAPLRDLACVVAAKRFNKKQNAFLIRKCLTSFRDDAKMAGAILAGLTNVRVTAVVGPVDQVLKQHPTLTHDKLDALDDAALAKLGLHRRDLLPYVADHETNWAMRQVMRLGLWMQGRLPAMDNQVQALLTRGDIPPTTVLLAMMHKGNLVPALDFLVAPRGHPPLVLPELFDQHRWWYVLRTYLPKPHPPFWVWADSDLEQFQIDVLRDWYLLNRKQLAKPRGLSNVNHNHNHQDTKVTKNAEEIGRNRQDKKWFSTVSGIPDAALSIHGFLVFSSWCSWCLGGSSFFV